MLDKGGESGGNGGHGFRRQLALTGQAIPTDVSAADQNQTKEDKRARRKTSFRHRNGKIQFGMARNFSGLGAEPARDFLGLQA